VAATIYGLCALMAFICAALLLRSYFHGRYKLLLWGGICFCGLTLSNGLLVIDKVILGASTDLSDARSVITLISLLIFIYGLIWDTE
jgi:hypothetical protein